MRFVTAVLALVFSLAMAGSETHACPVHSSVPASHHQEQSHKKTAHCTCPQACCPSHVSTLLAPPPVAGSLRAPAVRFIEVDRSTSVVLPVRKHLLPLALAPPLALA